MTIEKKKRFFSTFNEFGEDLSEGNPILKVREEKILANLIKRGEELRRWLGERGMLPKDKPKG